MGFGRLALRATVGAFFVGHGTQKLFGWFGGGGPAGTGQFFEQAGLRPGKRNAVAAGLAEAGGGLLLLLGLKTTVAAALLQSVTLSAIRHVHAKNGPWVTQNGYEYTAVLTALLFGIAEDGPGAIALDGGERPGLGAAVFALGAAMAGSELAATLAEQPVPEEATPREEGVAEPAEAA